MIITIITIITHHSTVLQIASLPCSPQ